MDGTSVNAGSKRPPPYTGSAAKRRAAVPSAGVSAAFRESRASPPSLTGRVLDMCVSGFESKTISERSFGEIVSQTTHLVVFGITAEPEAFSVAMRMPIPDAQPYIVCAAPPHWNSQHLAAFKAWLEAELRALTRRADLDDVARILSVQFMENTFSFCSFRAPADSSTMIRIVFSNHWYVFKARDILYELRKARAVWTEDEACELARVFDVFSDFTMVASVLTGINLGSWYRVRMVGAAKARLPARRRRERAARRERHDAAGRQDRPAAVARAELGH